MNRARASVVTFALMTLALPLQASAQTPQTSPTVFTLDQAVHVRARPLSRGHRGARTDQRVLCKCQRGQVGVLSADRLLVAIEPRHGEQHLWTTPAAISHSVDVRSGVAWRRRMAAYGEAQSAPCFRGRLSTSVSGRRRSPPPKRLCTRARAGEALTRLDVQAAVATAFLGIAEAQRTVVALQADLDRRDVVVSGRSHPRRQSTSAGGGGVAQRRRTCCRPDTTHSGAGGRRRWERSPWLGC